MDQMKSLTPTSLEAAMRASPREISSSAPPSKVLKLAEAMSTTQKTETRSSEESFPRALRFNLVGMTASLPGKSLSALERCKLGSRVMARMSALPLRRAARTLTTTLPSFWWHSTLRFWYNSFVFVRRLSAGKMSRGWLEAEVEWDGTGGLV